MSIARHKVIRLTKSAFVSSCGEPTLKDRVNNGLVEFVDDGWRVVQRAVATESSHGSSEGRYDTVVVSGEMQENKSKTCHCSVKISVWLEKGLAFLRVVSDALETILCARHKKNVA